MTVMKIIRLLDPKPFVCPDQQAPRFAPAGNSFIRQVAENVSFPFSACSVDGYIVNKTGKVVRIFFKREFDVLAPDASIQEVADSLAQDPQVTSAKGKLNSLARLLGCGVDYLFSPMGYPYNSPLNCMFLFSVDNVDSGKATRRVLDYKKLAEHIRHYRGRSFWSPKPITVSTSAIECYLANNHRTNGFADPFPGDLDLAVLKGEIVYSIAEFKTHNLQSDINSESCLRYQDRDRRRLDVLLNVTKQLECKLYFLFWGDRHDSVKVEEISLDRKIIRTDLLPNDPKAIADFLSPKAVL